MRALLLAIVVMLPACSPSRFAETVRVLQDIAAGDRPSPLKESTGEPQRRPVVFTVDDRTHEGDLYTPAEGALARLVLTPGVSREGKDDPRLVDFATTFARARFEVLVPDLPHLRRLQVRAADARTIADAVIYMDERGGPPLGMAAISFAVGPALLALLEPGVDQRLAFVMTVGGYYDVETTITFFLTGNFRGGPEEPWRYRRPNDYGKWVFVMTNAWRLDSPADRAALQLMAQRKLEDDDNDVSDLAALLGPEGQKVQALLANTDPDRVPALIDDLPEPLRREARALDLKRRDLGHLAPPVHPYPRPRRSGDPRDRERGPRGCASRRSRRPVHPRRASSCRRQGSELPRQAQDGRCHLHGSADPRRRGGVVGVVKSVIMLSSACRHHVVRVSSKRALRSTALDEQPIEFLMITAIEQHDLSSFVVKRHHFPWKPLSPNDKI